MCTFFFVNEKQRNNDNNNDNNNNNNNDNNNNNNNNNNNGVSGALLYDISKVFECILLDLFNAKLKSRSLD